MSDENIIRMNISIPKFLKEEWEIYAKKEGLSISGLIRLSVNEYLKKEKKESNIPNNNQDSINNLQKQLEQKLETKLNQFSEMFKKLTPITDMEDDLKLKLKTQIMAILGDNPSGIEPKKIAKYIGFDRAVTNDLIKDMSEMGLVDVRKGLIIKKDSSITDDEED